MKKIGIVTLNGYENYGNRLQVYALEKIAEKYAYQPELLVIDATYVAEFPKGSDGKRRSIFKRLKKKIRYWSGEKKALKEKKKEIKEFSAKFLHESFYKVNNYEQLCSINKQYEYFFIGSDQVWNPDYVNNIDINFLRFAESEKCIAVSPSFGITQIPRSLEERYRELLGHVKYLSSREYEGCAIINKLINRNAPTLVDPTMMLTKDEWSCCCNESKYNKIDKRYMFTYFLGDMNGSYKKRVKKIAQKYDLEIIDISDFKSKYYVSSPFDFVALIKEAEIICTDSFHGCVFSIIMEKPFVIFERDDAEMVMNSRLNTLLDKFSLQNRRNTVLQDDEIKNIDYISVGKRLLNERKLYENYLNHILKVI